MGKNKKASKKKIAAPLPKPPSPGTPNNSDAVLTTRIARSTYDSLMKSASKEGLTISKLANKVLTEYAGKTVK